MERYWEWLCSIKGLYRIQIETLLAIFQTPEQVYTAADRELDYLLEKGCSWILKIKDQKKRYSADALLNIHREQGIYFVSCQSGDYPEHLANIPDKPYGIFYKGRLPDERKKSIGVVGARMCTRAGKERAEYLAERIALKGGLVISGAASGIDGAAQWSALERGGYTCAVLGCGVDQCYPKTNNRLFERLKEEGGIVSEYPPGTMALASHFPQRNRIISGMSDVVVVMEARRKSGTLITAGYAAEQGRTVWAVPGSPEQELSEGCNELISQGAEILLSVDSFIHSYFSENKQKKSELSKEITLAPSEELVYSSLGLLSKSLWELEESTVLSLAELGQCLLSLEMKGLIKETERNYYARKQTE